MFEWVLNTPLQHTIIPYISIQDQEFFKTFKALKSLKINQAPGFDPIDVNVINHLYDHIKKPIIRLFGDSIKLGVFPEN